MNKRKIVHDHVLVPEHELKELRENLSTAAEALEFYAMKKHYYCYCEDENLDAEDSIRHKHEWTIEQGETARAALEKIRSET